MMRYLVGFLAVCLLGVGCQMKQVAKGPAPKAVPSQGAVAGKAGGRDEIVDKGWTKRIVTEKELLQVNRTDPALTPLVCREILARLNAKAPYHISDDIRSGHPLKAPNDFRAYKDWTPLPRTIADFAKVPKLILIVKEYPFMGWYENGKLKADTYACIGRAGEDTEVGVYRVEEKDHDHVSRSYRNSYGDPAWMPWAMRIYDHVWIHAGDVTGAYCSHGCVILPVEPAQEVFLWADGGVRVVVIETLADLPKASARVATR